MLDRHEDELPEGVCIPTDPIVEYKFVPVKPPTKGFVTIDTGEPVTFTFESENFVQFLETLLRSNAR
jgi:hypothetical protein